MTRFRAILAYWLAAVFVMVAPAWCCCASPAQASCHESATQVAAQRGCCSAPQTPTKKCCPTDAPKKCCGKDADASAKCGASTTCQGDVQKNRSVWNGKPPATLTPAELVVLALPGPPWVAPPIASVSPPHLADISFARSPVPSLLSLGCMLTI